MKLIACEIQGPKGVVRLEAPDNINKLKPGFLYARYGNYTPEAIANCEDRVVVGQKIALRIGHDHPDDPDAIGVLINVMRETNR